MKVICNKSGQVLACENCFHSTPHNEINLVSNIPCTKEGPCYQGDITKEARKLFVKCIPYPFKESNEN